MKHFKTIAELIEVQSELIPPGGIYIEGIKKDKIETAEFWFITSKEAKEQDTIETEFGNVPASLVEYKVKRFLDVQTFQDIIELKLESDPNLTLMQTAIFIEAINYYLENDDFQ
jgi:hypothetical protein